MGTEYFEGWNRIIILLYDVVEFGRAIFKTGWWMFFGYAAQPAVEVGGFEFF